MKGYPQYMSCVRDVLKEWKGSPGVYYKIIRYDPGLKMSTPVIVSWMDVVFYRVSPNRKQDQTQRKDQRDGNAGGKKVKSKKRKDVTEEINDLFNAVEEQLSES